MARQWSGVRKMDKLRIKFFLDILMFLDLIAIFLTGYLGRKTSELHSFFAYALIALLLIHFVLNWVLIKVMFRKRK